MQNIQREGAGKRFSEAVIYNGVVYLAGQVPEDPSADFKGQTRQVLAQTEALLAQYGSNKTRILSCQIFLADIRHIATMNEVWDTWVVPGHAPARATVEARLSSPEKLIEVCVTAALVT